MKGPNKPKLHGTLEKFAEEPFNIVKAKISSIKVPLTSRPFHDATMGPFNHFNYYWLTIFDEDGAVGEVPCGEMAGTVLAPLLLAHKKTAYERLYRVLYWNIRNRGFRSEVACALGAIDLALHDIMAKRRNLPLHRFWGARRDKVEVYGSGGGTHLNLDETARELAAFVANGHRVVKMKVGSEFGQDIQRDVKRVAAARRELGKGIKIAIDANQCWTSSEALDFANRVAEYEIAWFEEPVHSADLVAMREVAARCPFPVAMGESERSFYGFRDMASIGVQHLQPPPHALPSVSEWMQVRDLCLSQEITLSSGGYSPVTAAYVATAPEPVLTEYLAPLLKDFCDTLSQKPNLEDGWYVLPEQPGLPVKPDWDVLRREGRCEVTEI